MSVNNRMGGKCCIRLLCSAVLIYLVLLLNNHLNGGKYSRIHVTWNIANTIPNATPDSKKKANSTPNPKYGSQIFANAIQDTNYGSRNISSTMPDSISASTAPLVVDMDTSVYFRPHSNTFCKVSDNVYVLSAYVDERENDFDNLDDFAGEYYVRIMALIHEDVLEKRERIYCVFYGDSATGVRYYELSDNHEKPFRTAMLSCKVPPDVIQFDTVLVSGYFMYTELSGCHINVQESNNKYEETELSVCIPPSFGVVDPFKFIEWMELSQILGVEYFTLYFLQVDPVLQPVLQYYMRKRLLRVELWPLPQEVVDAGIWHFGQTLAIQDCLYKNMARTRYLASYGLDEMIIPRGVKTLTELVESIDEFHYCGFQFSTAFFDPDWQSLREETKDSLFTASSTVRSSKVSHYHTKWIVKSDMIFAAGIHNISKPTFADSEIMRVSLLTALLHHYNNCTDTLGVDCQYRQEDDTVRENYGGVLQERVDRVKANAQGLP